jgi:4'-phosphopantetheinyl transferase EntD
LGDGVFERLLPAGAVVAEGTVGDEWGDDALFPEERAAVVGAVAARRSEFAAGRRYARRALAILGLPGCPIPVGPGREPRWPPGVTGSITHCAGYCAVAVGWRHVLGSLGIDLERDEPLASEIEELVCRPVERRQAAALRPSGMAWTTIIFSAKESLYKAWFPLTGRWLDFHEVEVEVDPGHGTFAAHLAASARAVLELGGPVQGRFLVSSGYVATAVVVPDPGARAGAGLRLAYPPEP